ncbi:hypothetical protein POSPLADRAFT_1049638 [Postia placenta MAD-698-R-SB12]|uniref:Uncharacterized protein n=1 Tax=Postia placenta MAD-698-R-SB12 TaxID=670580 RepID=A0A1X6MN84_9APHY|nr:hypothetical protein POSPLADRAFT_1049638 [Postia placenta MAD-698-R-SB12]OSX57884.1 hypothetical protein POSPLADRAFT_1049638 [Postia placenta MAD-698-R-SB12]
MDQSDISRRRRPIVAAPGPEAESSIDPDKDELRDRRQSDELLSNVKEVSVAAVATLLAILCMVGGTRILAQAQAHQDPQTKERLTTLGTVMIAASRLSVNGVPTVLLARLGPRVRAIINGRETPSFVAHWIRNAVMAKLPNVAAALWRRGQEVDSAGPDNNNDVRIAFTEGDAALAVCWLFMACLWISMIIDSADIGGEKKERLVIYSWCFAGIGPYMFGWWKLYKRHQLQAAPTFTAVALR